MTTWVRRLFRPKTFHEMAIARARQLGITGDLQSWSHWELLDAISERRKALGEL